MNRKDIAIEILKDEVRQLKREINSLKTENMRLSLLELSMKRNGELFYTPNKL